MHLVLGLASVALSLVLLPLTARAQQKLDCPLPVKPGVAIGGVRLGMSLEEAKAAGSFIPPGKGEPPVWRLVHPAGLWSFRLGGDKRVEEITLQTSKPCLDDGVRRVFDMTERSAQLYAPLPDCGGQAGGGGGGWNCSEHGAFFWWGPSGTSVIVRRPGRMQPFKQAPPPLPKPPARPQKAQPVTATVPELASAPAGEAGAATRAAAVPAKAQEPAEPIDPCAGNWSPAPGLACGFFGRTDSLAIECYPTQLCMGTFAAKAAGHLCVHGANGEPLGAFVPARGGRSLAYRFDKPVAVGTPVRVYVDRDVRVVPPASSYQGPNPPADPAHDPKVVGVAASFVHGGRRVANGWVLDLQVPSSAGMPAAMIEKKVE